MSTDTQVKEHLAALEMVLLSAKIRWNAMLQQPATPDLSAAKRNLKRSIEIVEELLSEAQDASTQKDGAVKMALDVLEDQGFKVVSMEKGHFQYVRPFLDLSLYHVPVETKAMLENIAAGLEDSMLNVSSKEGVGFWIYAEYPGSPAFAEAPIELRTIMSLARDFKADWICLDEDGPKHVNLPTFDHDE